MKSGEKYREIVFLPDDSLCEHHKDQKSNKTLHDPSCTHSTAGWIQLCSGLNSLYINMFKPISATPLSKLD